LIKIFNWLKEFERFCIYKTLQIFFPLESTLTSETNELRIERLIEEFAVMIEVFGLPKLAGRLFSALLFGEPPEKSTQDLIRLTGGSKGAISQMLRLLGHAGPIEKCASLHARGHCYRLRRHFMVQMLEQKMNALKGFHDFFTSNEAEFAQMIEFQKFFERISMEAFNYWKEQKSKRVASDSFNIVQK